MHQYAKFSIIEEISLLQEIRGRTEFVLLSVLKLFASM
jgi:hypothetical protein